MKTKHIKSFSSFLFESSQVIKQFDPEYFKLPYNIPEDRFESGLLKINTHRRSQNRRNIIETNSKYKSKEDFLSNVTLDQIQNTIDSDVKRVLKFLRNNALTGKSVYADYEQETDIKEYLETDPEDRMNLGIIALNSNFTILVDYDIYKNIAVYTFGGDALFYYYTIFTLEPNDVVGSGENNTYITSNELINQMFYETVWRYTIQYIFDYEEEFENNKKVISFKNELTDPNIQYDELYNYNSPITKDYFNKDFISFIKKNIFE